MVIIGVIKSLKLVYAEMVGRVSPIWIFRGSIVQVLVTSSVLKMPTSLSACSNMLLRRLIIMNWAFLVRSCECVCVCVCVCVGVCVCVCEWTIQLASIERKPESNI